MAGFQDQLIGPAPYVETLPVDAYTKVGMIKQQQYDQGVEKVQSYIDNVAGLDVVHPEQKQYLNQRISQLQSKVQTIAGQDFSNQQIVNSVGALTKEIAGDPIVQNAVYSTQAYRQEQAKMKKAQSEGKSAPSNEYVFGRDVNKWLTNKDATSSFNAEYNPYTDYKGKMLKALNESIFGKGREDEWITEMPYKRDANGKALVDANGLPMYDFNTLVEKFKGVSAEKIRNIIDSTLDENDKRQIGIDGQYEYRGLDKEGLKTITDQSYSTKGKQIQDTIEGLKVKQSTSQGDADALEKIKQELAYQQKLLDNNNQGYLNDIDNIDKNPEGYKGSLYGQNWLSQFSEGLSNAQHSLTYEDNPGFKNSLAEKALDEKWEEFKSNKEFQYADLELRRKDLDFRMGKTSGVGGGNLSILEPIDNPDHTVALDEFVKGVDAQKEQSNLLDMELLSRKNPNLVDKIYDKDGNPHFVWASDPNATPEERKAQADQNKATGESAINTYRASDGTGDVDLETWKTATQSLQNNYKNGQKVVSDAEANADKVPELNVNQRLRTVSPLSIVGTDGQRYNIPAKDIVTFEQKVKKLVRDSGVNIDTSGVAGSFFRDLLLNHSYSGLWESVSDMVEKSNADKIFTPSEKAMWISMKKDMNRQNLTQQDVATNVKIRTVDQAMGNSFEKRQTYIANQLKNVLPAFQPVATPLEQFKGEDKLKSASWVQGQVVASGKNNTGLNYNESDMTKMLGKANIDNTKFYIIDRGNNKFSVRVSNADVIGTKKMEIDLTRPAVENLLGGSMGVDLFKDMRNMQRYSSLSSGPLTTNVRRGGAATATPLNNGNITGFNVKYDIEQIGSGGQQIRLYVYDKTSKTNKEVVLNPGTALNEAQVIASLQFMTDDTIKTAIKPQPTQ